MTTSEARDLQIEMAGRVESSTPVSGYETIAASDVSFDRKGEWLFAAVIVVKAGSFELVEQAGAVVPAKFPYVPGLLSFREAPAVIEAYEALKTRPDVFICDGQGIAHPRRIGLASHIGLWLGIPTIGCAKSRLIGSFQEPGPNPGDWSPLLDKGETIGAVLRTRTNVKPLFVSPAHLSDLAGSIETVLSATRKYRLPVPIRMAHQFVNELRVQAKPET
jgi:deoxyribonuclease V